MKNNRNTHFFQNNRLRLSSLNNNQAVRFSFHFPGLLMIGLFISLLCYSVWGDDSVASMKRGLSMDGNGFWKKQITLEIINNSSENWVDKILYLSISRNGSRYEKNNIPLAGEQAQSLRICDDKGREYLFNIYDTNMLEYHQGILKDNFTLSIVANCKAGQKERYHICYDNDKAWVVPDWLPGIGSMQNTDVELENNGLPANWSFDKSDETHIITWSSEKPHSGKKCIKTEVKEGADPSWIAARQGPIQVESGAKYKFSAWIRGINIKGNCGLYVHIGNEKNSMITSKHVYTNEGSFEWKKVSFEFDIPKNASLLNLGTVLRGTGTACYDSFILEKTSSATQDNYTIKIDAPQISTFESWYSSVNGAFGDTKFQPEKILPIQEKRYVLLSVMNCSNKDVKKKVFLDTSKIIQRWHRTFDQDSFTIYDLRNKPLKVVSWNNNVFFDVELKKNSCNYLLLVENSELTPPQNVRMENIGTTGNAFPGTSLQNSDGAFPGTSQQTKSNSDMVSNNQILPSFIREANHLVNGDMENGLEGWKTNAPEEKVEYKVIDPGKPFLGHKALEMKVGEKVSPQWRGFHQKVAVKPGAKYFCGYWISTDSKTGGYQVHLHQSRANGQLSSGGMSTLASSVGGQVDWTLKTNLIQVADDTEFLEFHLTSPQAGTVRFDGLFMIEAESVAISSFEGGRTGIFQIPTIVKVFPDTTFASSAQILSSGNSARISMAKNESEGLQIALRSPQTEQFRVAVSVPVLQNDSNKKLATPEVFSVGLVPVDYPTNYYSDRETGSKYRRHVPHSNPGCDGWAGWWPDPMIPIAAGSAMAETVQFTKNTIDIDTNKVWRNDSERLAAYGKNGIWDLNVPNQTRALRLLLKTDTNTVPGIYHGSIILEGKRSRSKTVIPYQVRVFNYSIPDKPVLGAIYDARISHDYFELGTGKNTWKKIVEYLVSKKLYPDNVLASPNMKYDKKTGKVEVDWTEFDKEAQWYYDELGIKKSYTPHLFYLFGWGMPPRNQDGEAPYPGEYPYKDVDRSQLRPEFKKIYQAKLRAYWDHLKEKGWSDKVVLYISDEPFYSQDAIRKQMIALCAMIHEVDPKIPIYSSTWHHIPDWDGSIDVWGVGHYGIVSEEQLKKSKERGDHIWWTTDGQMCLDTPYSAVERLLPYWCVRYGADAYEFWGASWFTYNPFDYGSHSYIPQSDQPGVHYYVRYPNGDGFIVYPGRAIGSDDILSSIRLEEAREGMEDAASLLLLKEELQKRQNDHSKLTGQGRKIWDRAMNLVPIPTEGGRYSSLFLTDPSVMDPLKFDMGNILEQFNSGK